MSKHKVLWHSNAPWAPTGYGQQTALFAPHLAEHYDFAISAFYGLEGSPLTYGPRIPVYPGMGATFGDENLVRHAKDWFGGDPRGGTVVTLMDVWVMDPKWAQQVNMACWTPVDHDPAPAPVTDFLMAANAVPIAMSQFGQRMLGRLDPLYVPHGIDTDTFRPRDRRESRHAAGVPQDAFLVGMVAANKGRPSRKGFTQALQAFAGFAAKHDNAYLYLHTMVNPGIAQGEDLPSILNALNIPSDRVLITDQYRIMFKPHPADDMARIYSTMDVLLNPSMGEGFGIPIIEAQACGVPVIVTDFTAMSELCGAGWQVEFQKTWTGQGSWQATPSVGDIYSALEECYGMSNSRREKLKETARKFSLQYSLPRVLKEHMLPALRMAEKRFADQRPVTIAPRLKAAA